MKLALSLPIDDAVANLSYCWFVMWTMEYEKSRMSPLLLSRCMWHPLKVKEPKSARLLIWPLTVDLSTIHSPEDCVEL